MNKEILTILFVFSLICCNRNESSNQAAEEPAIQKTERNVKFKQGEDQSTVRTRFKVPPGFRRSEEAANSFQEFLRNLELKPEGSFVKYYDGSTKSNRDVYDAVIDLEIGDKDLHQCADAVMRLRAEYLWTQKQYEKIHFNFTNGHQVEYIEWMSGKRMNVKGNRTWWSQKAEPSNTYQDFWNYLELIFMYAGTASLEKEMRSKNIEHADIGDVLIQGGHPGHAVIIIDKAIHNRTGEATYLLAQSYMPAQEIQVLRNPNRPEISPWYTFEKTDIRTPEWRFNRTDLKEFRE